MKRKLFLVTITLLFIFNINCVKAETCDNADIERLKQVAQGIMYTYEYIGNEYNYQLYRVTFDNLTDELYIRYNELNFFNGDSIIYVDGGMRQFDVYANNCFEKRVDSIKIELPKFNEYSLLDECVEIGSDNLDVCYEWYSGDLDYNQFEYEINNYYSGNNDSNFIVDFIKKNYLFVIGSLVIIIVLVICLIVYARRKKRLE